MTHAPRPPPARHKKTHQKCPYPRPPSRRPRRVCQRQRPRTRKVHDGKEAGFLITQCLLAAMAVPLPVSCSRMVRGCPGQWRRRRRGGRGGGGGGGTRLRGEFVVWLSLCGFSLWARSLRQALCRMLGAIPRGFPLAWVRSVANACFLPAGIWSMARTGAAAGASPPGASDCVLHYSSCPLVVHGVENLRLALPPWPRSDRIDYLAIFLVRDVARPDVPTTMCWHYVLYRAYNSSRAGRPPAPPRHFVPALSRQVQVLLYSRW